MTAKAFKEELEMSLLQASWRAVLRTPGDEEEVPEG